MHNPKKSVKLAIILLIALFFSCENITAQKVYPSRTETGTIELTDAMLSVSAIDAIENQFKSDRIEIYERNEAIMNRMKIKYDSVQIIRLKENNLNQLEIDQYDKALKTCMDGIEVGGDQIKELHKVIKKQDRKIKWFRVRGRLRTIIEIVVGAGAGYCIYNNI